MPRLDDPICERSINRTKPGPWRSKALKLATPALLLTTLLPGQPAARKWGVERLADEVDAIVVGEVLSTQQTGKSATGVLGVTRTIKGSLQPNDRVNINWTLRFADEKDRKGAHGMWFLRQASPNQWNLVAPLRDLYVSFPKGVSPSGIQLPAAVPALPRPTTTGDQVAAEMVSALQASKDREEIRLLATMFFACDSTPFVKQLHRVLRASSDPELRFIGLVSMLRQNDLSALKEMADNIDLIPRIVVGLQVQTAIMSRREWSPEIIQILAKFAASQDPNVQYAGTDALSAIHTRETLPYLVQLLDSPHQNIRRLAMAGLSAFVRNLPIQTAENVPNGRAGMPQGPAPYRTPDTDRYWVGGGTPEKGKEAEYIQFWKGWWAKMRGELTQR